MVITPFFSFSVPGLITMRACNWYGSSGVRSLAWWAESISCFASGRESSAPREKVDAQIQKAQQKKNQFLIVISGSGQARLYAGPGVFNRNAALIPTGF